METIGSKIKSIRLEAGITQLQLANFCGCSGQVISNIERGYSQPPTDLINKIADFFNVPADYILGLTSTRWTADNPYATSAVLSSRVSMLMEQLQMDVSDLAASSGMDEPTCRDILANAVKPNLEKLAKLAEALHTTVDYLIGNSFYHTAIANEDEQDIILDFRKMSKKEKRIFLGMMEEISDKYGKAE